MRYHNTENGPRICRAQEGNCPLGGDHFDSKAAAQLAYEGEMGSTNSFSTLRHEIPQVARSSQLPLLTVEEIRAKAAKDWAAISRTEARRSSLRSARKVGYGVAAVALIAACTAHVDHAVQQTQWTPQENVPSLQKTEGSVKQAVKNSNIVPTLQGVAHVIVPEGKRLEHQVAAGLAKSDLKTKAEDYVKDGGLVKTGTAVGKELGKFGKSLGQVSKGIEDGIKSSK